MRIFIQLPGVRPVDSHHMTHLMQNGGMIVLITRVLLVLQLASAIGLFLLAVHVWRIEHQGVALLLSLATVLLFRLLITANNFFIAWRYRSQTPTAHAINGCRAWRLFLGEFRATMTSSSWTMAFHAFSKRAARDPKGLPVLLIHGYGCNSGYWHPMSKVLMRAGITHHAVDLEPVFGSIDDYVPIVARAVETLCGETGHPRIVIVAHSMGGLVARAYLRDHGADQVAKVITLGTPHRGTGLANFGIGSNSAQMRWSGRPEDGAASDWLRQLEISENDTLRGLFISMYSHHDNIVAPQTSSNLPGAANIEFQGIGHVALAFHPEIQQRVIDEIMRVAAKEQKIAAPAT